VCGSAESDFRTDVILRTRFDDAPFFFCSNGGDGPPQFVAVTGQMQQPGQISIGAAVAKGTTSPWTFDLMVDVGTHDVAAYGETTALLHRNVEVSGNATLPAIDLAQGGAAYSLTPLVLANGMTDETIETVAEVFTGNDIVSYRHAGTTLYELPGSLLTMNDFQFNSLEANTANTSRTIRVDGGSSTLTLMPRLSGITFTDDGASWSELPDSTAEIRVFASAATNASLLEVTGGYLAGATEVSASIDAPGYDDAWRLSGQRGRLFVAADDEASDTSYTDGSTATARVQLAAASRRRMDRVKHVRSAAAVAARALR
jgi:hypothetical protein